MPVRVIEPNPNWSTVGLRNYKNDWPWGPVTIQQGAHNHTQGPNPSVQFLHL